MPNLTIKVDEGAMSDLLPLLDDLEKNLAQLMGVPIAACNVMAIAVHRPTTDKVTAYLEFVFMGSTSRTQSMIEDVGLRLAQMIRAAIGGEIQFRGFPMTAETIIPQSLKAEDASS